MPLTAILIAALVPEVATDLRSRRIPNALTGPAALAAIAFGGHLAAGALAAALLGVAALGRPDGMGLGDAKLAGVMGLCLGAPVLTALLVACAATVAYGLAARVRALPFAPFLALGAVAALVP